MVISNFRNNASDTGVDLSDRDAFNLEARGREIWDHAKPLRSVIEDRWQKSNRLYNSEFDQKEREWSDFLGVPKLFIAKTYAQIQRILEEVLEVIFFDFEEIVHVAQWKSIPSQTLDIVKGLLNYRLNGHPVAPRHSEFGLSYISTGFPYPGPTRSSTC